MSLAILYLVTTRSSAIVVFTVVFSSVSDAALDDESSAIVVYSLYCSFVLFVVVVNTSGDTDAYTTSSRICDICILF